MRQFQLHTSISFAVWLLNIHFLTNTIDLASCTIINNEQQIESLPEDCSPLINLPFKLDAQSQSQQSKQTNQTNYITQYNKELIFDIRNLSIPLENIFNSSESPLGAALKLFQQVASIGAELRDEIDGEDKSKQNIITFTNNQLKISGLNLTSFSVHLYTDSDPKCSLGVATRNVSLSGAFNYYGPLSSNDESIDGYYRIVINHVSMAASTNLTKKLHESVFEKVEDGRVRLQPLPQRSQYYSLVADGLKMGISSLGYISIDLFDSPDFTNKLQAQKSYIFGLLKRVMQRTAKKTYNMFEGDIRKVMEIESKRSIDCQLSKFTPILDSGPSYHNDVAKIINSEIEKQQLATVALPDCDYNTSFLGTKADIHFTNGLLKGLDRLKLNGETRAKLQDKRLLVNSSIGWNDLTGSFDWTLYLSTSKEGLAKGSIWMSIKEFNFDTVITKGLLTNSSVIVDELTIKKMDGIKLDMNGLPGMNRITRTAINFLIKNFRQRLAISMQPVIKKQLERSLNNLSLFDFQPLNNER